MAEIDGGSTFAGARVDRRRAGPDRAAVSAPGFGLLLAIVIALTAVRLGAQYFSVVDINTDEAQYWEWGRSLAFGYFSKPPLIAWIDAPSNAACGPSLPCIRAPAPLFYAGTSLLTYATARVAYDAKVAFWAGLTLIAAPGVAFSARIMSTDVPLLFFWALALLAYLQLRRGGGWGWAALLAIGIGFGLLAKYAMAYFAIGVFGAALVDADARALLKSPRLWAGQAGGVVLFLPNVVWNLGNGFATATATADYVTPNQTGIHWSDALGFVAAQFAVLGPVTFAVLLVLTARFASPRLMAIDRTMVMFAVPPVVVVVAAGLYSGNAYANWAATAAVAATIVAAAVLVRDGWRRLLVAGVVAGLASEAALIVSDAVADQVTLPFLGRGADIYKPTMGWRGLADAVDALVAKIGAAAIAVEGRDEVSTLSYYRRSDPQPVLVWSRSPRPTNQFELTQALKAGTPEPILFLSGCGSPDRLAPIFATVVDIGPLIVPAGPTSGRAYRVFLVSGAKGPIPPLPPCS